MPNTNDEPKNEIEMGLVTQEDVDIRSMIYTIRGRQVMLDFDLAKLYDYTTTRFNEQVTRNIDRFPEDFMFQLTKEETEILISQNATSRWGGRRKPPRAFTEGGVYILPGILRSKLAVNQHVLIIRAFLEMRKIIGNNVYMLPPNVHNDIEFLKQKQLETDETLNQIMHYISNEPIDKQKIFFDGQTYDAFAFIVALVESANESIVLIDGYTDEKTLNVLAKKKDGVDVVIYSFQNRRPTDIDIATFNSQYPSLQVKNMRSCHDRYLVLDNQLVYSIGASIKDAGKKSFSIARLEDVESVRSLIERLDNEN